MSLAGFAVTAVLLYQQFWLKNVLFAGAVAVDPYSVYFKYIILISSSIVVILSFFSDELYAGGRRLGEYFSLIVGMTFGMFLLCGSINMIMVYISIEIMSLSSYVLAGFTKEVKRSSEAALKYVIFGSVASGIMIYGVSIIYGLTGTFDIIRIMIGLQHASTVPMVLGILMILAGFAYKISAVPFHFWTPDVYEGAPITITALLSVASKAAGMAILVRFMYILSFSGFLVFDWRIVIAVISVLTMTVGNLIALWQTNFKRLLAYSSIAHAGYILMALVVMDKIGMASIMIYLFNYMFMNLGAFAGAALLANKIHSEELDDYTGIGYRAPALAVCMVIFLISLAGIPPTGGFIGKLYVFTAVLNAGSQWVWLAVIGVINSAISLYYYVKVFRNMFVRGTDLVQEPLKFSVPSISLVYILAFCTLFFGLYFTPIVNWANYSAAMFFGK